MGGGRPYLNSRDRDNIRCCHLLPCLIAVLLPHPECLDNETGGKDAATLPRTPQLGASFLASLAVLLLWFEKSGLEKKTCSFSSNLLHLWFMTTQPGIWDTKAKNMPPLVAGFCWFSFPSCLTKAKLPYGGKNTRNTRENIWIYVSQEKAHFSAY